MEQIAVIASCGIVVAYIMFAILHIGLPPSISETFYRLNRKWLFSIVLGVAASLAVAPLLNHTPEDFQFLGFFIIAGILFVAASPAFKDEFEGKVHTGAALILCFATIAWLILTAGVPYIAIAGVLVGIIRRREFIFWLELGLLANLYKEIFVLLF